MYQSPSYEKIAADFSLWQEYIDPDATMPREEFDGMSHGERVAFIDENFGPEVPTVEKVLVSCPDRGNGKRGWRTDGGEIAVVPLLRGPVRMSAVFLFQRPAGHYRKDGTLKPTNPALVSATGSESPLYHCVKPDASKLQRSTEDALSKLAYEDDARLASCVLEKSWCVGDERPGALITLIPLQKQ
jgi:Holliday junction resolvase RusA-like endonuclease